MFLLIYGLNGLLTAASVILGRAIKNEYLALGVLTTAFSGAYFATSGSKESKPAAGGSIQKAKESVPINASSRYVVSWL